MTTPAKELAKLLARHGRHGDTELVHMSKAEVHALKLMSGLASGGQSINPVTGLPEAFDLSWLIPIAAIAAIALTGGAAAPAIGAEAVAGSAAVAPAVAAGATAATEAATVAPIIGQTLATTPVVASALPAVAGAGVDTAGIAAGTLPAATGATTLTAPGAGMNLGLGASATPYAAPEAPSLLSQAGSWMADNPLPALLGANALGNMFTPSAKPENEDQSSEPGNEFRPGQGSVPFEQKGVRYAIQQPIDPFGSESVQIGYGPSVAPGTIHNQFAALDSMSPGFQSGPMDDLKLRRKFAVGGRVRDRNNMIGIAQVPGPAQTYGDQLAALKAQYASPSPISTPVNTDSSGSPITALANKFGFTPKDQTGGKRGEGHPGPRIPPGNPPPVQPPHDPSWYLSGLPAVNNPQTTPTTSYNPVTPQAGDIPQPPLERPRGYAAGGIAQGATPFPLPPIANPAPLGVSPTAMVPGGQQGSPGDEKLVMAAAAAVAGKIPNPEPILKAFVAKFGQQALMALIKSVRQAASAGPQIPANMGRLLSGPGGGTEDKISAQIDGGQPAALSSGEFVVPAHAVAGLGDGSTEHGARKLQKMVSKVNQKKYGRRGNPEPIDDTEVMPI